MSIGDRLKKEREKKGYSLDEVHSRLRIHPQILAQIEENRFDVLPAPIYTKGFIRRYSEFLELNPQEVIAEYDALNIKGRVALEVPRPSREANAASQALNRNGAPRAGGAGSADTGPLIARAAVFIVTVAVIWAVVGAIWSAWSHHRRESPVSSPSREAPAAKPASSAETAPPKKQNWLNSPTIGNFPKIPAKEPLRLSINAHKDAWTKVLAEGNPVYESILRPGQSQDWTTAKVFEIKMGRPDGVSITVNGMNLGSPAGGQATHIRITRDGVERLR